MVCSDWPIQLPTILINSSVYLNVLLEISFAFSPLGSVLTLTFTWLNFVFGGFHLINRIALWFNFKLWLQRNRRSFWIGSLHFFYRTVCLYARLKNALTQLLVLLNWLSVFVLFIKESEVVRVLLLLFAVVSAGIKVFLENFVRLVVFSLGCELPLIDTDMTVVITEPNIVLHLVINLILRAWMSWSVFIAVSISIHMSGCWSQTAMTNGISTSALILVAERYNFRINFLPLAQMWTILQTIGLLNEKHISVILRILYNLWSGPSVFIVYLVALVWLRTHWSICMCVRRVSLSLLSFITISCSEATKPWWIHLLLN